MNIKYLVALLVLLMLSTSVQAQRFNKKIHDNHRERNWEAGLLLQHQTAISEEFAGGSTLDIDSSTGFGFAFGWNWTEKVNLSWRFSLNKPDYTATIVPDEESEQVPQVVSYKMSKYSNQFNVTYNFLTGRFTPFVQAGLGWTKLDSNIPEGPPDINCWWDPWWGYICFDQWKTYKTSQFTYNLGLGLRWDINDAFFMRGSYNREFIKLDSGSTNLDTVTLEGGLMF